MDCGCKVDNDIPPPYFPPSPNGRYRLPGLAVPAGSCTRLRMWGGVGGIALTTGDMDIVLKFRIPQTRQFTRLRNTLESHVKKDLPKARRSQICPFPAPNDYRLPFLLFSSLSSSCQCLLLNHQILTGHRPRMNSLHNAFRVAVNPRQYSKTHSQKEGLKMKTKQLTGINA